MPATLGSRHRTKRFAALVLAACFDAVFGICVLHVQRFRLTALDRSVDLGRLIDWIGFDYGISDARAC